MCFQKDLQFEKFTNEFLWRYTDISQQLNIAEIINYEDDSNSQFHGTDIIINTQLGRRTCDIKACAGLLPTFSFELLGRVDTDEDGWLINPQKTNDYLLLVYFVGLKKEWLNAGSVRLIQGYLVDKTRMLDYLISEMEYRSQRSFDALIRMVKKIREVAIQDGYKGKIYIPIKPKMTGYKEMTLLRGDYQQELAEMKDNIYLCISTRLKEVPVNIIVPRHLIVEQSEKCLYIRPKMVKEN